MNKRLITTITVLLGGLAIFSTDFYLPALPYLAKLFHATPEVAKLSVTFYLLGLSISPLIFGSLADRFGRRPLFLLCAGIGLMGTLAAMVSTSMPMFILARILQGSGLGGCLSLARTVANDMFEKKQLAKISAIIGLCIAMGPAIAPIIGGYMYHHLGWRSIFVSLSIFISVLWMAAFFVLDETGLIDKQKNRTVKSLLQNYIYLLSNRFFMAHCIVSSMAISCIYLYVTVSPFILQTLYHLTAVEFGWSMAAITAGVIVTRLINIILVRHLSTEQIIDFSSRVMLIGSLIILIMSFMPVSFVLGIIIPVMIIVFGAAFIPINAMVSALQPFKHIGGSAGALYGSLQMFGAFLMSFVGSLLVNNRQELSLIYLLITTTAWYTYRRLVLSETSADSALEPVKNS